MNANTVWANKVLKRHPVSYWTTPLGYRKDGRPFFPIAGGDDTDDDDGDGDDDQDDDGDDDADDDGDGSDDDGADDDGDGDDLSDAEKKLEKRLAKQLETSLAKATERIADRLVNAEETRRRKAARQKARQQGGGDGGSGSGSGGGNRPKASELRDQQAQLDEREARTAYREYVADGFTFESSAEREAGQAISRAIIAKEIGEGADPDDAGKTAADHVRKLMKDVRAGAEKRVRQRLIKDGVIKKGDTDDTGDGAGTGKGKQQNRGPKAPGSSAEMQKGADRARQILPGRFKQE